MSLQFINATSNIASIGSQTSVAVGLLPSGVVNGDFLVMAVVTVPPTSVTGVPSSWNYITGFSAGVSFAGLNVQTFWKHASSEPSTYSVTFTNADLWTTNVICVRGQNGSSSAVDAATFNSSISGDTIAIPSLGSNFANDMWLGFAFSYQNGSLPAGFDLEAGFTTATEVVAHHAAMISGYKMLGAAGVYGPAIASVSGGAAFNPWVALSIFIAESTGASGTILRLGSLLGVGK